MRAVPVLRLVSLADCAKPDIEKSRANALPNCSVSKSFHLGDHSQPREILD
jgi:hypothetical protein